MPHRSRPAGLAALAVMLAACSNPRADAVAELTRLRAEMDAHAGRYGRYPQTLNAGQPATAANLPHRPPRGVTLYLLASDAGGYQAVATRRPWSCWNAVVRGKPGRVECTPNATSATTERPDTAKAREVFGGVLAQPDSAR
ncbi:MAG TPA: hypothetical protein VF771_10590 [Longimicrobiaceae bacterium]